MGLYPVPCGCNTAVVYSTSANCDDCIFIPDIVLADNDNLVPCGDAGTESTVDAANLEKAKLSAATGTLTWVVLPTYDTDKFQYINVDANGVYYFKFSTAAVPGEALQFQGRVIDVGGTGLGSIFTITVIVHNACLNKICTPTVETCNTCTGNCDPIADDVIVS